MKLAGLRQLSARPEKDDRDARKGVSARTANMVKAKGSGTVRLFFSSMKVIS
jgi:hypothetical protein